MRLLECWLFALSCAGLALGGWSIYWARTHPGRIRGLWGRRLFVLNLVFLCGSGLVAGGAGADSFVSLGLLTGFLLIAMLWESPAVGLRKPVIPADEIP